MNAWTIGFYFAGYALFLLGCIFDNNFVFLFGLFGLFWMFDSHMTIHYKELKDINNKLKKYMKGKGGIKRYERII